MRIELDVELKDVPGQLVRALEPISALGGNIISVVHMREERTGGRVPVRITFESDNSGRLEKILSELELADVWVSKVGESKKKQKITVVLIGHVVDTDLRDTIDRLNAISGVMVADMKLSMPHPEKESSALLDIEISDSKRVKSVMQRLEEIAGQKKLLVVKSLGV